MKKRAIVITILIIISGIFYYQLTEQRYQEQKALVTKITDGDTFTIQNNLKIRLKGINAPEKSMLYYEESTQFLEDSISNQIINLVSSEKDKYGRIIAYVFLDRQLINKQILEQGYANLYYYQKDDYYEELKQAEEDARNKEIGIWKKSQNADCIELVEFDFVSEGGEKLTLNNKCNELNIIIKDDATHIYKEKIPKGTWEKEFKEIWNDDGDTLYIWDADGLVLFHRY